MALGREYFGRARHLIINAVWQFRKAILLAGAIVAIFAAPFLYIRGKVVPIQVVLPSHKKQARELTYTLQEIDNGTARFFNSGGKPIVGYVIQDDKIVLLSAPSGRHPITGAKISGVTPAVINRWTSELKAQEAQRIRLIATKQKEQEHLDQIANEARIEAAKKEYIATLINQSIVNSPTSDIGIAILEDGNKRNIAVQEMLRHSFSGKNLRIETGWLLPRFVTEGLFDRLLEGDLAVVNNLQIGKNLDYLIIGKVTASTKRNDLQEVITTSATLNVEIIDVQRQRVLKQVDVTANGAGFDNDSSKNAAVLRFQKQLGDLISSVSIE